MRQYNYNYNPANNQIFDCYSYITTAITKGSMSPSLMR